MNRSADVLLVVQELSRDKNRREGIKFDVSGQIA